MEKEWKRNGKGVEKVRKVVYFSKGENFVKRKLVSPRPLRLFFVLNYKQKQMVIKMGIFLPFKKTGGNKPVGLRHVFV